MFAPANCLEIVELIRYFRGACSAQASSQNENFGNPRKKVLRNINGIFPVVRLVNIKTRRCLKYLVNNYFCKKFFIFYLAQVPSNFICLKIFVILIPFTQFQVKIGKSYLQKKTKISSCLITVLEIFSQRFKLGIESRPSLS